jgi:carbamoyltransferase
MAEGNYVFWFQDRMEYGPRALGNRSILAPSDSDDVKEKLNLFVKQREWFQPFAPVHAGGGRPQSWSSTTTRDSTGS